MATTFLGRRPSAPLAACSRNALAVAAQVHVPGQPAVSISARTAPIFAQVSALGAEKINNYMGTVAAAAAEGAIASSLDLTSAGMRIALVQGDKVKGGDARGIPPRGRPV